MKNYKVNDKFANWLYSCELLRIIYICFISESYIKKPASLADAEVWEYITEYILVCDLSGYVREVKNAFPQVLADEVAGEGGGEAFLYTLNGCEGAG